MKIIRIEIKDEDVHLKISNEGLDINKKSNRNVFYYTLKYIEENESEIASILKNIKKSIIEDEESFLYLSNYLDCEIYFFLFKNSLSTNSLDILLEKKNLKEINCYFIPSDYIHKFSEKNISIIFDNDFLFDSNFVLYNDLKDLKDIYYKKYLNFYSEKEIKNNLDYFLKVNRNLKIINLYYYSLESIKYITQLLIDKKINNVKILIHETEDNNLIISNDIKKLRRLNKRTNNSIKIIYNDEYFYNRIFKSLTFNGIKLVCILLMYVSVVLMGSNAYREYSAALEIRRLEMSLDNNETIEDEIINTVDEIDDTSVNTVTTVENNIETQEYVDPYKDVPSAFDKLEKLNSDFVGWIKVNNTSINYPVLKSTNNTYYLSHDIYRKKTTTGWIFMDYRNNENDLNKNTILYGHALKSGLMFGTLYKTFYKYWYTNEKNQIISFKTKNEENKYKIFSIYKVDETTDYMRVNFVDDEEFLSFIDMMKERSIYNFNVEVNSTDKIITLSTCSGKNRRLVVHAVKID